MAVNILLLRNLVGQMHTWASESTVAVHPEEVAYNTTIEVYCTNRARNEGLYASFRNGYWEMNIMNVDIR